MATVHQNLSDYDFDSVPNGSDFKIAIVTAEWNHEITFNLAKGAEEVLLQHGVREENIISHTVPGAFELPLGAQWVLEHQEVDAVIVCGCVIQGETRHFDFVCDGVTQGVTRLSLDYKKPVIFCVLTDNNKQQSIDRSGGVHGNKGTEAGVTALKMLGLKKSITA